jgi:hypothetical protein
LVARGIASKQAYFSATLRGISLTELNLHEQAPRDYSFAVAIEFWRMGRTPVPGTEVARFAREFESSVGVDLDEHNAHRIATEVLPLVRAAV